MEEALEDSEWLSELVRLLARCFLQRSLQSIYTYGQFIFAMYKSTETLRYTHYTMHSNSLVYT